VGDFDGEGHSDIGLWDPTRARALLDATTDGRIDGITPPLANNTDVPFMGDWEGDGVETLALNRKASSQGIFANRFATSASVQFESRSVAMPSSAIRDTFAPDAVHVYKF
jgi:hypothetical protein